MPVTIAQRTDVPELNKLVNSTYRGETSKKGWTTEAHLLEGKRIDEETLYSYFDDSKVTILKNTDEKAEITGCVYLEHRGEKLYIGMFSVSPLLQDQGIGRKLLTAAEEYALKMNLHVLNMTVIQSRHELISWYVRRGYVVTGETLPFHHGSRFGVPNEPITLIVLEKAV